MKRQTVGGLGSSLSKQAHSVLSHTGDRPSSPDAANSAPAAGAEGLSHASPTKREAQEKKSLGVDAEVLLRTAFAPWEHRESAASVDPYTYRPVSVKPGTPLPDLWRDGPSKQDIAKKKFGNKRKNIQPVFRGGGDQNKAVPRTQVSMPSSSSSFASYSSYAALPRYPQHITLILVLLSMPFYANS